MRAFLALLLLGSTALAQPDVARAQMRERVRNSIVDRLVRILRLDPPTAARFAEVVKRYDDQNAAIMAENQPLRRELKQLLDAGRPDDAGILSLTDRILANRARMKKLEDERAAELRRVLKPADYGRLILVFPQVNRQVRAEIFQALNGRAPLDGEEP
jgi:hypothetical protein